MKSWEFLPHRANKKIPPRSLMAFGVRTKVPHGSTRAINSLAIKLCPALRYAHSGYTGGIGRGLATLFAATEGSLRASLGGDLFR